MGWICVDMLSKVGAVPLAVPSDEELVFPALRRRPFAIVSNAYGSAAEDAIGEMLQTATGSAVRIPRVGSGYVNMDAISEAFASLLPVVRQEAPELLDDEHLPDGLLRIDPYQVKDIGVGHLAESVTFAITRRISRESHEAAIIIDRVARTLLEVRRRCASYATGLTLVIPGLERWDRPSLRCLYRAVLLARADDRFSVLATTGPLREYDSAPPGDPWSRIGPARARFLAQLRSTGVVRSIDFPELSVEAEQPTPVEPTSHDDQDDQPARFRRVLLSMGNGLVMQNYERVFLLARQALRIAADDEQHAQVRRLIGIADVQLENFAAGTEELGRAAELTTDPAFAAHLHYLRGLIETKRSYDLDGAATHYGQGLAVLDSAQPDQRNAECDLERAWLYNGQALVCALRAKAETHSGKREKLLTEAFNLEFDAFAKVRTVRGAAQAYLRHNLMANITFLLEISHRFDEAVKFWGGAFEHYLASDSQRFRAAYDTRLGLLLAKAGRPDEGVEILVSARMTCAASGDRFGEEELCLKLGYAYTVAGKPALAYEAYRAGLRLAHELREADICVDALAGMLCCLGILEAHEEFATLRDTVIRALPGTVLAGQLRALAEDLDPARALAAAGVRLPSPSPKQRAYIPSVDLEGRPSQDLNRYLVWGQGTLPVTSRP